MRTVWSLRGGFVCAAAHRWWWQHVEQEAQSVMSVLAAVRRGGMAMRKLLSAMSVRWCWGRFGDFAEAELVAAASVGDSIDQEEV